MKEIGFVDVHAHFVTDWYTAEARRAGHELPDGMPSWPTWSAETHLQLINMAGPAGDGSPDVMAQLRRLYYDTAGTPFPRQIPALLNLVDASRLLYGSDYPWPPATAAEMAATVADMPAPRPGCYVENNNYRERSAAAPPPWKSRAIVATA